MKDKKWLAASVVLAAALIAGIVVNINHNNNNSGDNVVGSISTDNGDLKINWNRYSTYDVELENSYTITRAGIYHFTGALEDGGITVKVGSEDVVKIILDNVTVRNSSGPAIACYSGDDLVIELIGENVLEDGASYSADYDEDVLGAIYSKADLTFEGDGSLKLTANYQDGIVGKDDVKFNSGAYEITAADDGIRGKDSVYIVAGTFNITSRGDSIKSTNETDAGKGFVLIESGDITISSGDDGIHAYNQLVIQGGNINVVKSYEGLEAQNIVISGGDIKVVASDDGINAGGGSSDTTTGTAGGGMMMNANANCVIAINGGNVYVNASGDGIDSNGYIYFNGGTVVVDGPANNGNGALDTGIGIEISGGTVIAVGSSGMAVSLGSTSSVNNASIYFSASQAAGTKVTIKNSAGETVAEHTSAKTFSHMSVGTPQFVTGETYTVYLNDVEYTTFTISGVTTTVGNSGANQMMPGGAGRDLRSF